METNIQAIRELLESLVVSTHSSRNFGQILLTFYNGGTCFFGLGSFYAIYKTATKVGLHELKKATELLRQAQTIFRTFLVFVISKFLASFPKKFIFAPSKVLTRKHGTMMLVPFLVFYRHAVRFQICSTKE